MTGSIASPPRALQTEVVASGGDHELLGEIIEALSARQRVTADAITALLQTAIRTPERNRRLFLLQFILQMDAEKELATRAETATERPRLSLEPAATERESAELHAAIERLLAKRSALRAELDEPARA